MNMKKALIKIHNDWKKDTTERLKNLQELFSLATDKSSYCITYDEESDRFTDDNSAVLNHLSELIIRYQFILHDYESVKTAAIEASESDNNAKLLEHIYGTLIIVTDRYSELPKPIMMSITDYLVTLLSCEYNQTIGSIIKDLSEHFKWAHNYVKNNIQEWLKFYEKNTLLVFDSIIHLSDIF